MRLQFEEVWSVNRSAWELWSSLGDRTVVDLGLGALLIENATQGWRPDAVMALIRRLSLIREILEPPKTDG